MSGRFELYPRVVLALTGSLVLSSMVEPAMGQQAVKSEAGERAQWIWSDPANTAPKNRWTYFRKVVDLAEVPEQATVRFAADSTARLWINGHCVRRKVARFHEEHITAEVVNAGPYLRPGANVVVVLHHNWGDITTFQRDANKHAGLYLSGSRIHSDASWRCRRAPELTEHDTQIPGVIGHYRIRYALIVDGRKMFEDDIHESSFDDSDWDRAVVVEAGPWPVEPEDVETPGQREYAVRPMHVVAAGEAEWTQPLSDNPLSMAGGIRTARYHPDVAATAEAGELISGRPVTIRGKAGQTRYVTFDFYRPVHGYPFLALADANGGVIIDVGYCELAYAQYDGRWHVDENGWINPEGVVGPGYADRYTTRPGPQRVELPDERTARWLALHIHFVEDGKVVLDDVGITKSQYPVERIGSFDCGNQQIDQIVKLCLIHAEVTMSDAYIDTPGREDGQWIEDNRPRALLAARWFGDHRLRQFMIRTLAEGQGDDGQLHPFAPSNFPAYPAPYDWSVQWVATLYDDYMWTGETDRIRTYWDVLTRYWDNVLSRVDDNGLWRTPQVLADIRVGERCVSPTHSSGVVTPWIIERLGWSAAMAEAIGQSDQGEQWRSMQEKMTDAFRKYHIVPAEGEVPAHVDDRVDPDDPDLERGYSQAAQTIAITSGLLTPEEALADVNYAFPAPVGSPPAGVTRWNNPTYAYRTLRALSHVGLTERAVAHLMERYAPYLHGHPRNPVPLALQGAFGGPLPEYWTSREDLGLTSGQINTAQPLDETGSHGWGAVPLLWLHDTLLGVQIVEPGGTRLRIAPQTGGLPYVAGQTVTPKGPVWVKWVPRDWRVEVKLPEKVAAEIVLPEAFVGNRIDVVEAPAKPEHKADRTYLATQAGRYVFEAR